MALPRRRLATHPIPEVFRNIDEAEMDETLGAHFSEGETRENEFTRNTFLLYARKSPDTSQRMQVVAAKLKARKGPGPEGLAEVGSMGLCCVNGATWDEDKVRLRRAHVPCGCRYARGTLRFDTYPGV